jgi:hypothetical protein
MRFLIACLLMLSACHKDEPPAPSAEQSAQLNEAEDMLNGIAGDRARNEEGPEDRSSGPSNSSD